MKSNLATILLVLVCLGLGVFLWFQNQNHAVEAQHFSATINSERNRASNLEEELNWQTLTNTILQSNLATAQLKFSNEMAAAAASLSATAANYDKAQADAKLQAQAVAAATAALAEKDKRIEELEGQNKDLDKQSSDLSNRIDNLNVQIAAAQKKLKDSEGDKNLLLAELKTLQAQKEELERKLSDLASLKEQVRILRDNLSIARRIDWIRRGLYDAIGQKGGERLISPPVPTPPSPPFTNKSLDVEIHQTGAVKINSPAPTNAPAPNAPAPR
jgi:chromosome segregation ATPase